MASSIPDFLTNMTLSTSPQISFEQADNLLLQALELRQEAVELQARIDALNERADVLKTTATGLQAIAAQDRAIIQARFDLAVELHTNFVLIYGPATNKSLRFQQLEHRVEDGLATMEELENFFDDLQSSSVPGRSERSRAPEPETPDTASIVVPSVEGARTAQDTPSHAAPLHKRKHSSSAGGANSAKRLKQKGDAEGGPSNVVSMPGSSQGAVPATWTITDAEGGPSDAVPRLPQESTEQHGRRPSVELGSNYHADGAKEIGYDETKERRYKSKSRQRRKLLAIAKAQVGTESTQSPTL
ncbi:uncharacterized protein A1O9_09205 [Exophiala aquamarina CBS 119918]|uniref:Uncharacterized protein n=1 Tax=Exophiala aquamarina CBS 119918 TaxID=1182545 RepID=A0A072P691_9EURO|nr:uncharacterized protein A1O9_09205 [Exophiala aquamarina CBS 119918]KEF54763.1 hypothetical protein A1O9_09205 [Exophiala aquamarina CBS 119918]